MLNAAKSVEISFSGEVYDRIEFSYLTYDRVVPALDRLEFAYDLSNVFENEKTSTYIDFVHVTPEANRLIADRIFAWIVGN